MTTMVRCLEGHPFDMDAAPTCPRCGSTVWRDAVREAAEKATAEAKRAKEARESAKKTAAATTRTSDEAERAKAAEATARAREEAAKATASATGASGQDDGDVLARAAQAARDAREAAAARAAAQELEERERIAQMQRAKKDQAEKERREQTDVYPFARGKNLAARAARAAREARGAGKPSGAWPKSAAVGSEIGAKPVATRAERVAGLLALFVGGPLLLFAAYTLILRATNVYQEISLRQPDNTIDDSVDYLFRLERKHSFMAGRDDVEYGPHAGRGLARKGIISLVGPEDSAATPSAKSAPLSSLLSHSMSPSDPANKEVRNPFWPPNQAPTGDKK